MKPRTADGYDQGTTLQARATCLYVATKLGDLMDEMVIIGGLVPSLLIPQRGRGDSRDAHVGTMDVDLALDVELLSSGLYETAADRLRDAGFTLDANDRGIRHGNGGGPTRPVRALASTSSFSRSGLGIKAVDCATFSPTLPP